MGDVVRLAVLGELRALVWCLRVARYTGRRRSLALKIRHRLRRLEGSEYYAAALRSVADLTLKTPCGFCGGVVRRRSRLAIKAPSQS